MSNTAQEQLDTLLKDVDLSNCVTSYLEDLFYGE